jgi:hypothetical protein
MNPPKTAGGKDDWQRWLTNKYIWFVLNDDIRS